jgi:hypothetical protein
MTATTSKSFTRQTGDEGDTKATEMEEQPPPPPPLHSGVLEGIARFAEPWYRERRHQLEVNGFKGRSPIDRQSLQHLVDFLDNHVDSHEVVITELCLYGINKLNFFARSDTTLTKFTLRHCKLGSGEADVSQLLAAFHTNRTVTDIEIHGISNLHGVSLGSCLSGLLKNMPQLQRLNCYSNDMRLEGVRAFQVALRANRTLKQLHLVRCLLGDDCIRLIVDALVGNTIMDALNIRSNYITSACLDDIRRLLESTQLKTINFWNYRGIFNDQDATQRFVSTLEQKKSSVQELPMIFRQDLPAGDSRAATYASIQNSLKRNQQLNHVASLLLLSSPPPRPLQMATAAGHQQQHDAQKSHTRPLQSLPMQSAVATLMQEEPVRFSNCSKPDRLC